MKAHNYQVFTGIENKRKTYIAVSAEIRPENALRIANDHFKASLSLNNFRVEAGYVLGKDLYIGYSDDRKSKPVWVVTRK